MSNSYQPQLAERFTRIANLVLRIAAGAMIFLGSTTATLGAGSAFKADGIRYSDRLFNTPAQACAEYVKSFGRGSIGGSPKYEGQGDIRCFFKDGDDDKDQVAAVVACIPQASAVSISTCKCDGSLVYSGGACVEPVDGTSIQVNQQPAANKPPSPECPVRTYRNRSGERIIESALDRASSRSGFEKKLFTGVEVGLKGWERAHSQGSGTGTESPTAIYYAPAEVNQKWQNCGVEEFLRDLVPLVPKDERLCLMTATTAHSGSLRLAEIQYVVTALKAGESPRKVLEGSISVDDARSSPKVTPSVTVLDVPDSMRKASTGNQSSRRDLPYCK